jgi:hypothetical protein
MRTQQFEYATHSTAGPGGRPFPENIYGVAWLAHAALCPFPLSWFLARAICAHPDAGRRNFAATNTDRHVCRSGSIFQPVSTPRGYRTVTHRHSVGISARVNIKGGRGRPLCTPRYPSCCASEHRALRQTIRLANQVTNPRRTPFDAWRLRCASKSWRCAPRVSFFEQDSSKF